MLQAAGIFRTFHHVARPAVPEREANKQNTNKRQECVAKALNCQQSLQLEDVQLVPKWLQFSGKFDTPRVTPCHGDRGFYVATVTACHGLSRGAREEEI